MFLLNFIVNTLKAISQFDSTNNITIIVSHEISASWKFSFYMYECF